MAAIKFGQLAQGVEASIKSTNIIKFIYKHEVLRGRFKDVTYGRFLCTIQPKKSEENCTRFMIHGDWINYPGKVATLTANLLVAKILFNSTISTPRAKFMTMDISNFYLNSPLPRPEYVWIKISNITEEIIEEYCLRKKITGGGHVHIKANKGMYGLLQAGLIANQQLKKR